MESGLFGFWFRLGQSRNLSTSRSVSHFLNKATSTKQNKNETPIYVAGKWGFQILHRVNLPSSQKCPGRLF